MRPNPWEPDLADEYTARSHRSFGLVGTTFDSAFYEGALRCAISLTTRSCGDHQAFAEGSLELGCPRALAREDER